MHYFVCIDSDARASSFFGFVSSLKPPTAYSPISNICEMNASINNRMINGVLVLSLAVDYRA